MQRKMNAIISIVLGISFCGSVVIGYMPIPQYIVELTCISNMCIGIILVLTGIRILLNKDEFPDIVYHMWLVTILLVCIISIGGKFNFKGAFLLLHLINPLAFLAYYIIFIDEKKEYKKLFFTPIPVIVYLSLDYVIGTLKGQFVYGIFEANELNIVKALIIVIIIYFFLLLIGYATLHLNLLIGKTMRKK